MPIIAPLPYAFTNGTIADATQVDANNAQILANVNANAAENGANSSITSLTGLTTPLAVAEGGTGATTAGALLQTTPSATSTSSATVVMGGLAAVFTPVNSTRILVTIDGFLITPVGTVNCVAKVIYGTGTPPTQGAAVTGTVTGNTIQGGQTGAAGNTVFPFSMTRHITGLSPGTAYWLDLGIATSVGGNTVQVSGMTVTASEV